MVKSRAITFNLPFNLGSIQFNREFSEKELDIVWKLYVELNTRKAAIPFDEENDIIVEVYNSWYQLFTSTREYLKEMPGCELVKDDNAKKIVKLAIEVLNKGLRPHLTKWQGKYRRWYDTALNDEKYKDMTPQDIQKNYPEYKELITDLKQVNKELMVYSDILGKLIFGDENGRM